MIGQPFPAASSAALVPGKEKGSVTVDSFEQVWKSNPGSIMLVDVRDPKEVASGMIKGSVNIPMNELEKKIATLPGDKPVVFVCGTGQELIPVTSIDRLRRGPFRTAQLNLVGWSALLASCLAAWLLTRYAMQHLSGPGWPPWCAAALPLGAVFVIDRRRDKALRAKQIRVRLAEPTDLELSLIHISEPTRPY